MSLGDQKSGQLTMSSDSIMEQEDLYEGITDSEGDNADKRKEAVKLHLTAAQSAPPAAHPGATPGTASVTEAAGSCAWKLLPLLLLTIALSAAVGLNLASKSDNAKGKCFKHDNG